MILLLPNSPHVPVGRLAIIRLNLKGMGRCRLAAISLRELGNDVALQSAS